MAKLAELIYISWFLATGSTFKRNPQIFNNVKVKGFIPPWKINGSNKSLKPRIIIIFKPKVGTCRTAYEVKQNAQDISIIKKNITLFCLF